MMLLPTLLGCASSGGHRWVAEITDSRYFDEVVEGDLGAAVELWTTETVDGEPFMALRGPWEVANWFSLEAGMTVERDGAYAVEEGFVTLTEDDDWITGVYAVSDVAEVTFEGVAVADLPLQDPDAIEGEWVGGTLTTAGDHATWLAGWCTSLGTLDGWIFAGSSTLCGDVLVDFRNETRLVGILEGF